MSDKVAPRGQGQERSKGIRGDDGNAWSSFSLALGVSHDVVNACGPNGHCVCFMALPNLLLPVVLARFECCVS